MYFLILKWTLMYFSFCPLPLVLSLDTTEKSLPPPFPLLSISNLHTLARAALSQSYFISGCQPELEFTLNFKSSKVTFFLRSSARRCRKKPKLEKSSNADDYTSTEQISEGALFGLQISYSRKPKI